MPKTFPMTLVVHSEDPDWSRFVDANLSSWVHPVHPAGLEDVTCTLDVLVVPDVSELAHYLLELVHQKTRAPVILLSDQLANQHGASAPLGKIVRGVCLSHGRLSSLVSLGEAPAGPAQPFLACVETPNGAVIRTRIEEAATRLHLLGAPDAVPESLARPARFRVQAVESREHMEGCLRLRHHVYRHVGYLSQDMADAALDMDYHDRMSLHFAAVDSDTGAVAGTARVVMPHRVVSEMIQVRGVLADGLEAHQRWAGELANQTLSPTLRRRVQMPGCAPLPMFNYLEGPQDWAHMFGKVNGGAELSRFAVDPRYRGEGVSKLLAHVALASALELDREMLFLECLPHYAGMYRKYGFEELPGGRAMLEGDGLHSLLESMACRLSGDSRLLESLRWDAELLRLMGDPVECKEADHDCELAPTASGSAEIASERVPDFLTQEHGLPNTSYDGTSLLHAMSPSYILDEAFRFIDWNPAFYHLIGKDQGMRRGMHVTVLIPTIVNIDELTARSLEVFAPGKNPLTDTEIAIIQTDVYGELRVRKHAAQLLDDTGRQSAWIVQLKVCDWENAELPLYEDIMGHVTRAIAWQQVACLGHEGFEMEQLDSSIAQLPVASEAPTLVMGLGPGTGVEQLVQAHPDKRFVVQEPNQRLIEALQRRAPNLSNVKWIVAEAGDYAAYPNGYFGAACVTYGAFRGDVGAAGLARVVRPGGPVSVLASGPGGLAALLTDDAPPELSQAVDTLRPVDANSALEELRAKGFAPAQRVASDAVEILSTVRSEAAVMPQRKSRLGPVFRRTAENPADSDEKND